MNQQQAEQAKRNKLQDEKPYVLSKLKKINDRHAQNIATPMIDMHIIFGAILNVRIAQQAV